MPKDHVPAVSRDATFCGSGPGVPSRCKECGSALVSPLVCLGCTTLQRAESHFNHFSRLGLPLDYNISPAELEKRYLVLARGLHPDQFSQRPADERGLAEQLSAQLNESYKTLRDPVRRAEYLLELAGGPSRDTDKRTPKAFLAEMLEWNEEIEAAGEGGESKVGKLEQLRAHIGSRLDAAVATLDPAFRTAFSAASEDARRAALVQIRETLNVCAYLQGLTTQIGDLLLR